MGVLPSGFHAEHKPSAMQPLVVLARKIPNDLMGEAKSQNIDGTNARRHKLSVTRSGFLARETPPDRPAHDANREAGNFFIGSDSFLVHRYR